MAAIYDVNIIFTSCTVDSTNLSSTRHATKCRLKDAKYNILHHNKSKIDTPYLGEEAKQKKWHYPRHFEYFTVLNKITYTYIHIFKKKIMNREKKNKLSSLSSALKLQMEFVRKRWRNLG